MAKTLIGDFPCVRPSLPGPTQLTPAPSSPAATVFVLTLNRETKGQGGEGNSRSNWKLQLRSGSCKVLETRLSGSWHLSAKLDQGVSGTKLILLPVPLPLATRFIFAATFTCLSILLLFLSIFFINICTQHGSSSHEEATKRLKDPPGSEPC